MCAARVFVLLPQEWRARAVRELTSAAQTAYRNLRRAVTILPAMTDWTGLHERARERYFDGESRLPDDPGARQKQLTRMGNAAGAAGLTALMAGDDGREWFGRAAERYRESWENAPPGSWGRPIGAIKARILAGDWDGAAADARWALETYSASASPIGRYAAALAHLVLGKDLEARVEADALLHEDFPEPVANSIRFIAAGDVVGYVQAVEDVLRSFEERDEYLEDVPVADTVLVLQALAARRDMAAELESQLLP
jgi:hypothetical protein